MAKEDPPHNGELRDDFDAFFSKVYAHLRQIAHHHMRGQRPGHTLSTTALVSSTYEKMVSHDHLSYADRDHFLRVAARAMRQILVDHARSKMALKRNAGQTPLPLDREIPVNEQITGLIDLNDALEELERFNPVGFQIVELRYFGGLTMDEIAQVVGVNERTVRRKWNTAKAWLYEHLRDAAPGDEPGPPEPGPSEENE